jgi:hypothetical protein
MKKSGLQENAFTAEEAQINSSRGGVSAVILGPTDFRLRFFEQLHTHTIWYAT